MSTVPGAVARAWGSTFGRNSQSAARRATRARAATPLPACAGPAATGASARAAWVLVASVVVAFVVPAGKVCAQLEGLVHLRTGFVPDPAVLQGRAHGARPASSLAPQCAGFVGDAPNHVLVLDTRFGFLRMFATGPADLVLAVRASDGSWLCSEDRFGAHPSVEGVFAPGRVEIWVGLEVAGQSGDYVLRITEMRSVRPGMGAEIHADDRIALARELGLEIAAQSALHGAIRLRRGFLPDPRYLEGIGGGPIDAAALGGSCRGRITGPPTHVLTLLTEHDFLQLFALPETADAEPTLVVVTPDGRVLCDAGGGETVQVSAPRWPQGVYRIWVGSVQEDTAIPHRLGISEIRRVR